MRIKEFALKRVSDLFPSKIKFKISLRQVILVVSLCVFVFSLYNIGKKLYAYHHDNKQYEQIKSQIPERDISQKFDEAYKHTGDAPPEKLYDENGQEITKLPYTIVTGNPDELDSDGIISDYSKLKKTNNDMIGWINIPGFKKAIDYPIMQSNDNEYYLYRDFYKNNSYAGSIFMDNRNNPLDVDRHIIIYGHAMRDFSMFGNLKDYPDKVQNHTELKKIYIDLMNTRLEYEVFSTYYEHSAYNYRQTNFANDAEFEKFIETIKSKSVYEYNVNLTPMDKILTISTCNNDISRDTRSIIHARLVRQIIYDKSASTGFTASQPDNSIKKAVSANVYLSELEVKFTLGEEVQSAQLNPAFDTKYREFSAQISPDVDKLSLIVKTADPEAKVSATMNDEKIDLESILINQGENIIKLKVTSRDQQYSRTYIVRMIR